MSGPSRRLPPEGGRTRVLSSAPENLVEASECHRHHISLHPIGLIANHASHRKAITERICHNWESLATGHLHLDSWYCHWRAGTCHKLHGHHGHAVCTEHVGVVDISSTIAVRKLWSACVAHLTHPLRWLPAVHTEVDSSASCAAWERTLRHLPDRLAAVNAEVRSITTCWTSVI